MCKIVWDISLTIEIQIFSLQWIGFFTPCFTDIKMPNVFHHLVQAKKSAFQFLNKRALVIR